MAITQEQWDLFASFREGVEAEYTRSVLTKPERLTSYAETTGILQEAISQYGIDRDNPEQVYYTIVGIVSTISFLAQYLNTVCNDPHMMGHISESAVFMGYLVRELCFGVEK
jgi:hypothetical protein